MTKAVQSPLFRAVSMTLALVSCGKAPSRQEAPETGHPALAFTTTNMAIQVSDGGDVRTETLAASKETTSPTNGDAGTGIVHDAAVARAVTVPPCSGGYCTKVIVTRPNEIASFNIAGDGGIYWQERESAEKTRIMRIGLRGGTPTEVAQKYRSVSRQCRFLNDTFYCVNQTSDDYREPKSILRLSLEGAAPSTITSDVRGDAHFLSTPTTVYWVSERAPQRATVVRPSQDGGSPVTIASNVVGFPGIATDPPSIYWKSDNGRGGIDLVELREPDGVVTTIRADFGDRSNVGLDEANIYYSRNNAWLQMSRDGGAVTTLASGLYRLGATHRIGDDLYYQDDPPGDHAGILKVSHDGGTASTFASPKLWSAAIVGWDEDSIYWTDRRVDDEVTLRDGSTVLYKSPRAGGKPTSIMDVDEEGEGFVVRSGSIYWLDRTTNSLMVTSRFPNKLPFISVDKGSSSPLTVHK